MMVIDPLVPVVRFPAYNGAVDLRGAIVLDDNPETMPAAEAGQSFAPGQPGLYGVDHNGSCTAGVPNSDNCVFGTRDTGAINSRLKISTAATSKCVWLCSSTNVSAPHFRLQRIYSTPLSRASYSTSLEIRDAQPGLEPT